MKTTRRRLAMTNIFTIPFRPILPISHRFGPQVNKVHEPWEGSISYEVCGAAADPYSHKSITWAVVLAGVQKGGTTSLAELIMNHSGICISKRGKETHFHDVGGCAENIE